MFWLRFLVHFHDPLQHPSVHRGRNAIQRFLQEENGIVDICFNPVTQFHFLWLNNTCFDITSSLQLDLLILADRLLLSLLLLLFAVFRLVQVATSVRF